MTNIEKLAIEKAKKDAMDLASRQIENSILSYEKISELTGYRMEIVSIIHRTVAKDTTPSELSYFLSIAKSVNLNPLNKEIWCYKSAGNLVIFTGRDGFLKKCKENPDYLGMRSSEVCESDEFSMNMITGEITHTIKNQRGKVIGAYAIVYIKDKKDIIVYLDFDEYNLGQAKWRTSPKMMIKKCAQSTALKEAAGITGIQVEESFIIKEGEAISLMPENKPSISKESERLIMLINSCKSIEDVEKYKNECIEDCEIEAYNNKLNSLK